MLPAAFVPIHQLPLTSNGKLDRNRLPAPAPPASPNAAPCAPPRSPLELLLADLWRQILHLDHLSLHDNFFALGGDSILSMRVIARAAEAGIRITPTQFYEHSTIAGLARVAEQLAALPEATEAENGAALVASPIQQWFLEQNLADMQHFNQALVLEFNHLEQDVLERAVQLVITRHDALRQRFSNGAVTLGSDRDPFITWVNLSSIDSLDYEPAVADVFARAQSAMNLSEGPLFRFVGIEAAFGHRPLLLIAVHHLAVDAYSWRILLDDLRNAYANRDATPPIDMRAQTSTYRNWVQKLVSWANSEDAAKEALYWRHALLAISQSARVPIDHVFGANGVSSAHTTITCLGAEETRALLEAGHAAYKAHVDHILLAGLAAALAKWMNTDHVRLHIEGHGREPLFEHLDLSSIVGWFTAITPVDLKIEPGTSMKDLIRTTKETLRSVPHGGCGYGILRYLHPDPDLREQLTAIGGAEILFNYLGQLDEPPRADSPFFLSMRRPGPTRSPHGKRTHLLEINAGIRQGRFEAEWTYSCNFHRGETIELLATDFISHLRRIIQHCTEVSSTAYSPSDFPRVQLDQSGLDQLVSELTGA
jgi:non-ribosomal peptide synthase protein (TIGR01720 family)